MSVTLSPPNQLGFPRPLTQLVKRSLFIHNPHSSPIAFKVKTTAPKQYCVRPNQGRVEPGEHVEVQVLLQPLPADPPPHAKCKDKFLVQSAFIAPDEELRTLPEMWAQVERTNKSAIQEQKIRCAYLPSEDGSGDPNGIPEENEEGVMSAVDQSRLDESFLVNHGLTCWTTRPEKYPDLFPNGGWTTWEITQPTVRLAPSQPRNVPRFPAAHIIVKVVAPLIEPVAHLSRRVVPLHAIFSAAETSPAGIKVNGESNPTITETPATPTAALHAVPSLTAADVAAAGSPANSALERSLATATADNEKLSLALQEVDRLRAQLAESQAHSVTGLRKRGGVVSTDNSTAGDKVKEAPVAVASGVQGVPLEIVVGLAFAVFVLTYLFF